MSAEQRRETGVRSTLFAHWETWRPYTLAYAGLVGLAGAALATPHPEGWRLLGAWAAPTLGWLAGLYGGDYFDRELDAVAKPHRPIPSGRIRATTALSVMIGCVLAGAVIAYALNWRNVVFAAVALLGGIAYSTVFKARGFSGNVVRGSLTALAFLFGTLATAATPPWELLPVAALFLLHDAGSNLVGTLRDIDGDRLGGYATLAVRRGVRSALAHLATLYGLWVAIAVWIPFNAPVTRDVWHYAALVALAAAGGLSTLVLLVRAPDPMPPRTALRAHEILVVERMILAGALVTLGAGAGLGLPLAVLAVVVALSTQTRMRERYEFASARERGPSPLSSVRTRPGA